MLNTILRRSLIRQVRRKMLSLVAVALGITVTTVIATIAVDVGDKVSRELRSVGANISVTPAADGLPVAVGGVDYRPAGAGAFLSESNLSKLKRIFWRNNIIAFAPMLYVPASTQGRRIVVVGTWFDRELRVDKTEAFETGLERLHPTWSVSGEWPNEQDPGWLVGQRLARTLSVSPGQQLAVSLEDGLRQSAALPVRGILDAGGPEDDELIAPLSFVQKIAGLAGKVRRIEVSAVTKPEDKFARSDVAKLSPKDFDRWYCTPYVSSIAYQIRQAIPGSEAKPVFQVAESEGKILNRVGVLMGFLVAAALITAALAVASMMLATVLERKSEIGLFKCLGATDARVATVFLMEACLVGLLGGLAGYAAGSLLAYWLEVLIFGVAATVHWVILPGVVSLALLIAVLGSALPLVRGLNVSPAVVLRNG